MTPLPGAVQVTYAELSAQAVLEAGVSRPRAMGPLPRSRDGETSTLGLRAADSIRPRVRRAMARGARPGDARGAEVPTVRRAGERGRSHHFACARRNGRTAEPASALSHVPLTEDGHARRRGAAGETREARVTRTVTVPERDRRGSRGDRGRVDFLRGAPRDRGASLESAGSPLTEGGAAFCSFHLGTPRGRP